MCMHWLASSNRLQFVIYFLKKCGIKIMRSWAGKMREIISAQAEMRELTENACVSGDMRETWHVGLVGRERKDRKGGAAQKFSTVGVYGEYANCDYVTRAVSVLFFRYPTSIRGNIVT